MFMEALHAIIYPFHIYQATMQGTGDTAGIKTDEALFSESIYFNRKMYTEKAIALLWYAVSPGALGECARASSLPEWSPELFSESEI